MRNLKYFGAQLKRMIRLAVGIFPTAMLLFACFAVAAHFFIVKDSSKEGRKKKYQVGVVGDTDASYLGFGIQAVQTLDSSRLLVDFLPMTREEASERFLAGELTTYIDVPEEFLDSLIYGRNDVPITYVSTEGQKGLAGSLMEELAKIVSRLVISSQNSIYSMQEIMISQGQTRGLSDLTDKINYKLIEFVLGRTKLVQVEKLGATKGLSFLQYYFCALVLLFCFLFGTCSAPFFLRGNEMAAKWMKLRGIGPAMQILCEWCAYYMLLVLCVLVPLGILGKATGDFAFLEWDKSSLQVILALLPLTAMISAFQFMLYEWIKNPVAILLLQFVLCIGMGYVSGFFFPVSFFPKKIAWIGGLLPTGISMEYFSGMLLEEKTGLQTWKVIVYTLVFFVAAVLARRRKIYGEA